MLNREQRATVASPRSAFRSNQRVASPPRTLESLFHTFPCSAVHSVRPASRTALERVLSFAIDFLLLCFQNLTNPFSRNSRVFTSIQNPRCGGQFGSLVHESQVTSRGSRIHKSRLFICLPPLFLFFYALSRILCLCFQSLARSFAKYRGWYPGKLIPRCLRRSSLALFRQPTSDRTLFCAIPPLVISSKPA
jgi:hypothetical protein